jgi:hypothetical protein
MLPFSQRSWARMLAAGCAGWVGLTLFRTRRMAELVGVSESEIRALGVRDLGSAVALVVSPDPRPALAVRALFDVSDAARYGRGRPAVLAMTLGFAALGALGLFARRP